MGVLNAYRMTVRKTDAAITSADHEAGAIMPHTLRHGPIMAAQAGFAVGIEQPAPSPGTRFDAGRVAIGPPKMGLLEHICVLIALKRAERIVAL